MFVQETKMLDGMTDTASYWMFVLTVTFGMFSFKSNMIQFSETFSFCNRFHVNATVFYTQDNYIKIKIIIKKIYEIL